MKYESQNKILNRINTAKYVCLFGLGALIDDCYDQIVLSLGKEPDFFCDNNSEKWGEEFYGKKCLSPDELERIADDTVVLITVKNFESIYKQLVDIGIKDPLTAIFDRTYNSLVNINSLASYSKFIENKSPFISEVLSVNVISKWRVLSAAISLAGYFFDII